MKDWYFIIAAILLALLVYSKFYQLTGLSLGTMARHNRETARKRRARLKAEAAAAYNSAVEDRQDLQGLVAKLISGHPGLIAGIVSPFTRIAMDGGFVSGFVINNHKNENFIRVHLRHCKDGSRVYYTWIRCSNKDYSEEDLTVMLRKIEDEVDGWAEFEVGDRSYRSDYVNPQPWRTISHPYEARVLAWS